jgi:dihydropteroate synthase
MIKASTEIRSAAPLDAIPEAASERFWLRPLRFLSGAAAAAAVPRGLALPLAGGSAFSLIEFVDRSMIDAPPVVAPLAALREGAQGRGARFAERVALMLERLSAVRPSWAGFALDRPLLMGIVNVTPDSFSDGGDFVDPARAVAHGRALLAAGADILDIGGESTRPGATPTAPDEEIRRIAPVIRELAGAGAVVSVDTRHAPVMAAALERGARIINDVSALAGDERSLAVASRAQAAVALMHMQGEPRTMQQAPRYDLASLDIVEYLEKRIAACIAAGIPRERIAVDPGIGFGKRSAHNLEILARLGLFHALGCAVLLGVSRKALLGAAANAVPPKQRLPGSLAGALYGLAQGVQILRVHDVAETRRAIAVWRAASAGA